MKDGSLFLTAAFIYQWVLIPTLGQIPFGLTAMAITLLVLKRIGRKLLSAFKQRQDNDTSRLTKSLLSYYGIFLLIAALTVAAGLFLNASYPDFDKQARDKAAIEQLFSIHPNKANSQL